MADDFRRHNAHAVHVAQSLIARHGADALNAAIARRQAAIQAGETARADLYQGVCTILADQNQVFTRWKARRPLDRSARSLRR